MEDMECLYIYFKSLIYYYMYPKQVLIGNITLTLYRRVIVHLCIAWLCYNSDKYVNIQWTIASMTEMLIINCNVG